jgi:membrane-associated protease RseP (regulator of RpoE activity)
MRDELRSREPQVDLSENKAALLRLIVGLAVIIAAAVLLHGLDLLIVIGALVAMVMIHELGHFVTAKLSGMKVTEYFLGFGPRVWSMKRGETTYGVKALPAGGYVRITGMTTLEEVDPKDEARSYRQASFPRRLLVAVSGSAMHFIMAFGLLWGMFALAGLPVAAIPEVTALTTFLNAPTPAKVAGFKAGDVLVSIDGEHFSTAQQFIDDIRAHPGVELSVVVGRDNHNVTLQVTPANGQRLLVSDKTKAKAVVSAKSKPTGIIGVDLQVLVRNETTGPFTALGRAGSMLASVTSETATGIAEVFSLHGLGSFAHQVATANNHASEKTGSSTASSSAGQSGQLLSILGAVEIGAQAARQNTSELLYLLVAINIFVGMLNLFPMLPLDGGHVAIAIYERIRSRRGRAYHADVTKLMPVAYLFLAFMVVIGLSALYVNIVHPATLPGS